MGNSVQRTPQIKEEIENKDEYEDDFTDEVELPKSEPGYPSPTNHLSLHDVFERKERWLPDDFDKGSDDAELMKSLNLITLDLNTMSDEYDDDIAETRRSTTAHKKMTLSFDMIDQHARMADPKFLESFEGLIEYLKTPLLHDQYKDIKTARAILVWLSLQSLEKKGYGKRGIDTPRGLMQFLKEKKMSYTTCYAILCRKAGLQCAIIQGYVKTGSGGYSPKVSNWNAVHGETGWQIVQAYWACRSLYGYNSGKWTKVEEDGKTMSKRGVASQGTEKNIFDEDYFMPDPEQFIYQCCAEEKNWQLVPSGSIVSSYEEFAKKPLLHFPFFDLELELISEQNCILETKDGACKIELKAKPNKAHMITLRYELFRKESDQSLVESHGENSSTNEETKDGKETKDREEEFGRMVLNSRTAEVFIFDIRFKQKTGIYKIIISGGPHKSAFRTLCEFNIICKQKFVGNLLPIDGSRIGWGPGPAAKEAGLILPSKPSGVIQVNRSDRKTDVRFQLRDITESYTAIVHGEVSGRRQKVENSVEVQKIGYAHQLIVAVSVPDNGEYGLSIQHMDNKKDDKWEDVCYYLVSTLAYKHDKANVKLAKKCLTDATEKLVEPRQWKDQISEIQTNIVKCKKEKVPESADEIITANAMLVYLTCRDKLRDCLLRRNIHVINKTLSIVSMYRYQDALTEEITKVKNLRDELIALGSYARIVPKLKDAHKEIKTLKHAPEEVCNTLKAILVLLGETNFHKLDWASMQKKMKTTYHSVDAAPLLYTMTQIEKQDISNDRLKEALHILHKYDEDHVRKVNTDAHCFYVWIENFIRARAK